MMLKHMTMYIWSQCQSDDSSQQTPCNMSTPPATAAESPTRHPAALTCINIAAGGTTPPLLPRLLLLLGADVTAELPAVAAADTGLLEPDTAFELPMTPVRAARCAAHSAPRCAMPSARRRALSVAKLGSVPLGDRGPPGVSPCTTTCCKGAAPCWPACDVRQNISTWHYVNQ